MEKKITIYQVLPRLFGNRNTTRKPNGTLAENGVGKFNNFDAARLAKIHSMGFNHVWFTGVIRHATTTDYSRYGIPRQHPCVVKGKAGSPYAIVDYYDVDPDLAEDVPNRMDEFEALIARTHAAGMKVIIDFVPNHVAREYHSICRPAGVADLGEHDDRGKHFDPQNNFYYCPGYPFVGPVAPAKGESPYEEMPAKCTGNDRFDSHPGVNDWYETVKLNYGVDYCDAGGRSDHFDPTPDTWLKMTDILRFWASKGIDGFRCDMAEMVPHEFWAYATSAVKADYPQLIFIGEVYDPNQYRTYIASGFDYLYDKVGMYDCLRDVVCGRRPASDITGCWQQTDDIWQHMLYFLENHDEQRIASDFFCGDARKALPAVAVALLFRSNPFMLYSGQEVGERGMDAEGFSGRDGRTTIFDYWSVDSVNKAYFRPSKLPRDQWQLMQDYCTLLRLANHEKAVRKGQTFDLMYVNNMSWQFNPNAQYAFLRKQDKDLLLVVANFSSSPVGVGVMIPDHAFKFLGLPEKKTYGVNLLTGVRQPVVLKANDVVDVSLPANGAVVLKIKL